MARKHKKKRRTATVPVASMGDIAFLLIIFFLLASEFNKDKPQPMTLPQSSKVEKVEDKVAIRVDIDKDGNIFLDGVAVTNAKDVGIGVEAILEGTISDDQRHVQFKCDMKQPKEVFEPVLQAIAEGGGLIEAVGELEQ
jgi:biopolymer transport protein ExbD